MGFFTRRLIPRKVRRLVHPVRAVKRAVTPKPIKKALRAVSTVRSPVRAAGYAAERAVFTKRKAPAPVYRHGMCPTKHRSWDAAQRCRKG
ncbi:MAG TPA: hypothetical protein VF867_19635 [Arthrobacter sp.]